MTAPLISVILPVYNASAFVDEAIVSILEQEERNFELLIANDGSTDDSAAKILSHSDPRIRFFDNTVNRGLIDTLNHLIAESKGQYIARMDADDVASPERFSVQLQYFREHPEAGLVSSFMKEMKRSNAIVGHHFTEPNEVKAALMFTNPIVHPAVMFRKDKLGSHLQYEKIFLHAEDYGLWMRLVPSTELGIVPQALISHRTHDQQVSVQHYKIQLESIKKVHALACRMLDIEISEQEAEMQLQLFTERYPDDGAEFIPEAEKWLLKLVKQNYQKNIFPTAEFEGVCSEWWFRINQHFGKSGQTSYAHYSKSALSGHFNPTVASKTKMIIRSITNFKKPKS